MWKMKKDAGTGYSGWDIMMMRIINGLYMDSSFKIKKQCYEIYRVAGNDEF
jgi:hypothetical protein